MTLFQQLSHLFVYELSVIVALQAASLTHQDASVFPQSYPAASLTNQGVFDSPKSTSLTHQTRKTHQFHQSSLETKDVSLKHQSHLEASSTNQDAGLIHQLQITPLTHQPYQASLVKQDARFVPKPHPLSPLVSLNHQSDRTAALSHQLPQGGQFSITSIMDSMTMPSLPAMFTGGATKCQALKSLFGLTYEQMLEKNSSKYESLTIDLITKDGNEKYNFTLTRRLALILKEAKEIIVLVHGFLESSDGAMVQALATEYLKQSGVEILALDGRKVINLEYFRSTTYARFMGEKLGHVLSDIAKEDITPSKFTLIGHSLGAHIAGIAGSRVHQLVGRPVGRVIGLDPAGPCFANVSADNRLDRADAEYVDVIHTNAGILGINEAIGHKDFFPGGGKSQPGCLLSTCDHSRAWQIFAESINAPHHFPACKCSNWTAFKEGLCVKNEVSFMGVSSAKGSPGLYYLNVAPTPPYGLGPTGSG